MTCGSTYHIALISDCFVLLYNTNTVSQSLSPGVLSALFQQVLPDKLLANLEQVRLQQLEAHVLQVGNWAQEIAQQV